MSFSWSSLIPAAAGIGSALIGSQASNRATDAQTAGNAEALALQRQMYDQNRADLAPYREAGTSALSTLAGEANRPFTETPGYQFRFDEGQRAVNSSMGAQGMLDSGARLKALTRYGTGMAEQGYGEYSNRLASLAGLGQTATGQGVSAGQGYAGAAGGLMQNSGQARAAGAVGGANALTGGINNATLLYALGGFGQ